MKTEPLFLALAGVFSATMAQAGLAPLASSELPVVQSRALTPITLSAGVGLDAVQ